MGDIDLSKVGILNLSIVDTFLILESVYILICIYDIL